MKLFTKDVYVVAIIHKRRICCCNHSYNKPVSMYFRYLLSIIKKSPYQSSI